MAADGFEIKGVWLRSARTARLDPAGAPRYRLPMSDLIRTIETKLRAALSPHRLSVEDESHLHAGHGGAAEHAAQFGAAEPSHIHIEIRAQKLADLSRLARHRAVMEAIADEVERIHAIRLTASG